MSLNELDGVTVEDSDLIPYEKHARINLTKFLGLDTETELKITVSKRSG